MSTMRRRRGSEALVEEWLRANSATTTPQKVVDSGGSDIEATDKAAGSGEGRDEGPRAHTPPPPSPATPLTPGPPPSPLNMDSPVSSNLTQRLELERTSSARARARRLAHPQLLPPPAGAAPSELLGSGRVAAEERAAWSSLGPYQHLRLARMRAAAKFGTLSDLHEHHEWRPEELQQQHRILVLERNTSEAKLREEASRIGELRGELEAVSDELRGEVTRRRAEQATASELVREQRWRRGAAEECAALGAEQGRRLRWWVRWWSEKARALEAAERVAQASLASARAEHGAALEAARGEAASAAAAAAAALAAERERFDGAVAAHARQRGALQEEVATLRASREQQAVSAARAQDELREQLRSCQEVAAAAAEELGRAEQAVSGLTRAAEATKAEHEQLARSAAASHEQALATLGEASARQGAALQAVHAETVKLGY
jgi:colicin import membrane protein